MGDVEGDGQPPRLGIYVGRKHDFSCPGDHATWKITLSESNHVTIACSSALSSGKGGLQPWCVEGTWEYDPDEEEITINITKDDPLGGPRSDRELTMPVTEDGALVFGRGVDVTCVWAEGPPDPIADRMQAMPLKELKLCVIASGLDPSGCIERDDLLRLLQCARRGGTLCLDPPPENLPASAKASPVKSSINASPVKSSVSACSPTPSDRPRQDTPGSTKFVSGSTEPSGTPPPSHPASSPPPAARVNASPPPNGLEARFEDIKDDQGPETVEEGCFSLEQLTDKRVWEKLDIKPTERETYLPEATFMRLFGVSKADFAKMPKWKKDNAKKKHDLF